MIKNFKKHHLFILIIFALIVLALILLMNSQADAVYRRQVSDDETVSSRIMKNLEAVPEYGVFDWITFKLEPNGKLSLLGWVVFQKTKTEAHRSMEKIPEIVDIKNQIQILPTSKTDDRIRNAAWKKFEEAPVLEKFVEGAEPTVHVIVNERKVSLFGKVDNKIESKLFESTMRKIPGVLSVDNNLHVSNEE